MNGELVNSCLVPVLQAAGADVQTVEGLAANGKLQSIQQAFLEYGQKRNAVSTCAAACHGTPDIPPAKGIRRSIPGRRLKPFRALRPEFRRPRHVPGAVEQNRALFLGDLVEWDFQVDPVLARQRFHLLLDFPELPAGPDPPSNRGFEGSTMAFAASKVQLLPSPEHSRRRHTGY